MINLNRNLTRKEYLNLHTELGDKQKHAYDAFVDAVTFKQYHAMTYGPKRLSSRYDNCVERISQVSKSKKLKSLALKADNAYHLLAALRLSYHKSDY